MSPSVLRRNVKEQIRAGRYQNENEVVRDAIRQMQQREIEQFERLFGGYPGAPQGEPTAEDDEAIRAAIQRLREAAHAGQASCLVSRDNDLLALGKPLGVEIITPQGFWPGCDKAAARPLDLSSTSQPSSAFHLAKRSRKNWWKAGRFRAKTGNESRMCPKSDAVRPYARATDFSEFHNASNKSGRSESGTWADKQALEEALLRRLYHRLVLLRPGTRLEAAFNSPLAISEDLKVFSAHSKWLFVGF
jgi:Arc/MetJ-type ribon-helix-helix transcriptional regulator